MGSCVSLPLVKPPPLDSSIVPSRDERSSNCVLFFPVPNRPGLGRSERCWGGLQLPEARAGRGGRKKRARGTMEVNAKGGGKLQWNKTSTPGQPAHGTLPLHPGSQRGLLAAIILFTFTVFSTGSREICRGMRRTGAIFHIRDMQDGRGRGSRAGEEEGRGPGPRPTGLPSERDGLLPASTAEPARA